MPVYKSQVVRHETTNVFHLHPTHRIHSKLPLSIVDRIIASCRIVSPAHAGTSREHVDIGEAVVGALPMIELFGGKAFQWGEPPVDLSYGDIVALAGDYYARADGEDMGYTGARRDSKALSLPLAEAGDVDIALGLVRRSESEIIDADATAKRHLETMVISRARHDWTLKKATGIDAEDEAAARGWLHQQSDTELRYYILAMENWDHFHPHCTTRYGALHRRAVAMADEAGVRFGDRNKRRVFSSGRQDLVRKMRKLLAPALRLNAFADHFLTDAFSSGHLYGFRKERVSDPEFNDEVPSGSSWKPNPDVDPDRILVEIEFKDPQEKVQIKMGEVAAAAWAKVDHDNWSQHGVAVRHDKSSNPRLRRRQFTAYGDGHIPKFQDSFMDQMSAIAPGDEQGYLLTSAVASSLSEIFNAFFGGVVPWADLGMGHLKIFDPPLDYVFHAADGRCNCK